MNMTIRIRHSVALALAVALLLVAALALLSRHAVAQSAVGSAKPYLTLAQLRARYVDAASKFAMIDGVEICYKDEGAGPALLLVHGSAGTMQTWDRVAVLLEPRYRVIRYDVPGQGLSGDVSDAVAAHVRPEQIAADLLGRLGVRRVTVIGVSSGGTLAIDLAARRPDLVARLIVSDAPADPVTTGGLAATPAWAKAQADAKASGFRGAEFWSAFLTYFAGDGRRISPATRAAFYDFNRRMPDRNMIALTAKVADHAAAVKAMAAVRAPALLVWGGSDKLLPPAAGRVLQGYLTGTDAAIVYLPDVGHFPPIETPDRFVTIVSAWMEAAVPLNP